MITEDERVVIRAEASRRRVALIHYGCSTYRVMTNDGGRDLWILCLCCGSLSGNENDVVNRYCGFCHCYHSDWVA